MSNMPADINCNTNSEETKLKHSSATASNVAQFEGIYQKTKFVFKVLSVMFIAKQNVS